MNGEWLKLLETFEFGQPQWLWLIPPLILLAWRFSRPGSTAAYSSSPQRGRRPGLSSAWITPTPIRRPRSCRSG